MDFFLDDRDKGNPFEDFPKRDSFNPIVAIIMHDGLVVQDREENIVFLVLTSPLLTSECNLLPLVPRIQSTSQK